MTMPHSAVHPIAALSDNYIWLIRQGDRAAVVDPGEASPVLAWLHAQGVALDAILLTHHHGDHVGGVLELVERYGCPVWGPARERLPHCDHPVGEGSRVQLPHLGIDLQVLDVPGHTAGHVAYVGKVPGHPLALFSGDTLFAGGCGRLLEGTPTQMYDSIGKFSYLPLETSIFCGHEYTLANLRWAKSVEGDNGALQETFLAAEAARAAGRPTLPSTIGQESATNPFMRTHLAQVAKAASQWAGHALDGPVDVFAALRAWKNDYK